MDLRPATDDDAAAIERIAIANDDHQAPGYVTHLREHGTFLVASLDGVVTGYSATREVGQATMLCDLFVDPPFHGQGIGHRLLTQIFDGAGERFTYASRDPRAMPLYVRHGMVPRWPLLYLSGPPIAAGSQARKVSPAEAAAAEHDLTGEDRTADYAFWGTGLIVYDGTTVVAAGAMDRDILLHLSPADEPALLAALSVLEGRRLSLCLPGPHPALPTLLANRWRIDEYDHYMSSVPDLLDKSRILSPSLS